MTTFIAQHYVLHNHGHAEMRTSGLLISLFHNEKEHHKRYGFVCIGCALLWSEKKIRPAMYLVQHKRAVDEQVLWDNIRDAHV